jgi:integrase/recombinase XerD
MKPLIDDFSFYALLHKFLNRYLPLQRISSSHTIDSYRQTMQLLRDYFRDQKRTNPDDISFSLLTKENIHTFLRWLLDIRDNSERTANQRLAAIKSFLAFCRTEDIALTHTYLDICQIRPFKIQQKTYVDSLSESQLKLLFSIPNPKTVKGRRDITMMIILYESGARIQELLDLKLCNIIWNKKTNVQLHITGKGNKTRLVPLLGNTADYLRQYMGEFHKQSCPDDYLFYTNHKVGKRQMSQGTVDAFLKTYAKTANRIDPLFPSGLHAHMLRHSIAMTMYGKGIPLSYIRDFLGHSSIETTSVYAYANSEMITKALEMSAKPVTAMLKATARREWKEDDKTLAKLCGLR